jgi:hypothetical protein
MSEQMKIDLLESLRLDRLAILNQVRTLFLLTAPHKTRLESGRLAA